ncbi:TolC family protein [Flavobacteriaceae bacterium XHP0103]|uniref:TolC family protein n=1 Tax=Marixanthotalea marina TaxID=2844359 RepID=UPI002989C4BB|nr:TolC family protein [Marixanthotalea marina]MBU3822186.1 TolC family protein [Marixanthotalea marina]
MKQTLIIILGILISIQVDAQEDPKSFSLEEAITYGLEHNRNVKNAAYDIQAAEKQKWETIATGLPQINGSVSYQDFLKLQTQVVPAEAFGGPPGEYAAINFGIKQNLNASATFSQLLFDGSYLVGLQSAKVFLEISKNAKEKTDLEVRKSIIQAYGNVLFTNEAETILQRNVEVLKKNLSDIEAMYNNGLEEEESVEQLQITLSGVESNLNNIRRLKKIAYQMLNLTMGLDINTQTVLTDNLESLTNNNIDLALIEGEESIESTTDYKIALNDKVSKELLVKLEKSKALPTLSASLTGGYLSYSDSFTFFDSGQPYYGFGVFGFNLNIPIFSSGLRSASTQRAKINLEISKENLTETEQQLKLQIDTAKSDYQFAIEEYGNKKKNLELAEKIEQKNETKFFEGVGSSFDLRQAQLQLYTSQQEYLQAMLDVINNKAELETLLNTPNN